MGAARAMTWRGKDDVQGLDHHRTARMPEPSTGAENPAARVFRGLTGALAAGLVLLALVLLGFQYLDSNPGPGWPMVSLHLVGAAVAVVLQVSADRLRGRIGSGCALGVLLVVAAVLWFGWYQ